MRRGGFLDGHVHGHELHGVGVARVLLGAALVLGNTRVVLQDLEGVARKHGLALDVDEIGAVPLLELPVREDFLGRIRSRGSGGRDGQRGVLVKQRVGKRAARLERALARVIHNRDAFGADQLAAPLGVQIEAAGNPRTLNVGVLAVVGVTVLVGLGAAGLVIRIGDRRVIGSEGVEVDVVLALLVKVPANQLVVVTVGIGNLNLLAGVDSERCRLGAELERSVAVRIGMQEDAVLGLDPLGVDRHALRHVCPRRLLRALLVHIPANKGEAFVCGLVVVGLAFAVGRDVRTVIDARDLIELATACLVVNGVAVTLDVYAIHIKDVVLKGLVANLDSAALRHAGVVAIGVLLTEGNPIAPAAKGSGAVIPVLGGLVTVVLIGNIEGAATGSRDGIRCGRRILPVRALLVEANLAGTAAAEAIVRMLTGTARKNEGVQERRAGTGAAVAAAGSGVALVAVIPPAVGGPGVTVLFKGLSI